MTMMLAMMAALADDAAKDDAIKTLVLGSLASYLGIATGCAFLFEGIKMALPKLVTGRENLLVLLLTLGMGALAKWLLPAIYGAKDPRAWGFHMLTLVFVAIIGMMFHDKLMDAVKALLKKFWPAAAVSGDPAAPKE